MHHSLSLTLTQVKLGFSAATRIYKDLPSATWGLYWSWQLHFFWYRAVTHCHQTGNSISSQGVFDACVFHGNICRSKFQIYLSLGKLQLSTLLGLSRLFLASCALTFLFPLSTFLLRDQAGDFSRATANIPGGDQRLNGGCFSFSYF